jgi:acetoacetyl-CoA reductase
MTRVAIVTGGTRGIGEAISLALREMGMTVAANYAGNAEKAKAFTERTGIKSFRWDRF